MIALAIVETTKLDRLAAEIPDHHRRFGFDAEVIAEPSLTNGTARSRRAIKVGAEGQPNCQWHATAKTVERAWDGSLTTARLRRKPICGAMACGRINERATGLS